MAAHFNTMGVLKNPRWERFAQELAKGKSQSEAYVAAGYECSASAAYSSASDLLRNPKISSRVDELQSRAADRAVVTVEGLISEAENARKMAMRIENPSAAVAAIREKGILSGKRIERAENAKPGEFAHIDAMTPAERRVYAAELAKRLVAVGIFDELILSDKTGGGREVDGI